MKLIRPLIASLILGACAYSHPVAAQRPAAPQSGTEVNLDFFYSNLQDKGDWLQTQEFGYVFRPNVQKQKANWRPYSDGAWVHTDEGWLWNSREDFGWATYHYGRWTRLKEYGWVWVPGFEWAPAWVAWRGTAPDGSGAPGARTANRGNRSSVEVSYIGWAPLPPEARFNPSSGFNASVDYEYNIAPDEYSFVSVRSFGDPYLAPLIVAPTVVYGFWGGTYGYTNIAYTDYAWGRGVYAGGPSYTYVSSYSSQPVSQYYIQRNYSFDNGGVNNFRASQPTNGVIPVFAPRFTAAASANTSEFKPATIAATVPAGQVQRGFDAAKGTPAQIAEAKAHVKTEAAAAPPATVPPVEQRTAGLKTPPGGVPAATAPVAAPAASPAATTPAAAPGTATAPATATPAAAAPTPAAVAPKPGNQAAPPVAPAVAPKPGNQATPPVAPAAGAPVPKNQLSPENEARMKAQQMNQGRPVTAPATPAATPKPGPNATTVVPAPATAPARPLNTPVPVVVPQPKPEAVAPKPEVRAPAPKPEVRAPAPKPEEVRATAPKPEVRAPAPKPEAPAPKPEVRAPKPEAPAPKPEVRASASKPEVRAPAPAASQPAPKPEKPDPKAEKPAKPAKDPKDPKNENQ